MVSLATKLRDTSCRAFRQRFGASSLARSYASTTPVESREWKVNGLTYKRVDPTFDSNVLFEFNKAYGSSPLNFIPDEPVKEHFSKLKTGQTIVWAAFDEAKDNELVGFISGEVGCDYWLETGAGKTATCFIHEFVVNPELRGKKIGQHLTQISVDPELGIFGVNDEVKEMYTTVHVENVPSRTAFVRSGYEEVLTYTDHMRDRATTVLKCSRSKKVKSKLPAARHMRVIGIQSGNAVDGIDVGIFDFEPLERDSTDPQKLAKPLKYRTVANKTFSFTKEQREYVLGLRGLKLEDGNEYARGNYKMGEWCAENVNALLEETNISKDSVQLVSSHGQTVSGHPHWEFGDLSVIAQKTGITTVGDFRPADVAAGGNGTPCTCTYDSIMLRPQTGTKWRCAINIGGTSSVTFCPPLSDTSAVPHGLDPGLGVFFMDLCTQVIDPTLDYDENGNMARSGTTNEQLLAEMLEYKYYKQQNLPIGVGPDDFPETLFKSWHNRAQELGVSNIDFLTTLTDQSTKQIALACKKFGGENIVGDGVVGDVILRGGVTNNSFWVERLRFHMSNELGTNIEKILTLDDIGLEEESWENAMYAMFGYLCFNNAYNFVPSCTGASYPVVGGRLAPGKNFKSFQLMNEQKEL